MKVSDAFPGAFLKAENLHGKRVTVTIDCVKQEDIGSEIKPVVYFLGKDKGLVLNKTNANEIAEHLGDEMDSWAGGKIVLFGTKTEFHGKMVPCIRVDAAQEKPVQTQPEEEFKGQDDIPF